MQSEKAWKTYFPHTDLGILEVVFTLNVLFYNGAQWIQYDTICFSTKGKANWAIAFEQLVHRLINVNNQIILPIALMKTYKCLILKFSRLTKTAGTSTAYSNKDAFQ